MQAPLNEIANTANYLTKTAFTLRDSINMVDSSRLDRYLSILNSAEDISTLGHSWEGFIITSWRGQEFYNQGWEKVFGAGCDRVRWFGPVANNFAIVMPEVTGSACDSSPAGIEVALGVLEEHFFYLKEDELLSRFAEWR